VARPQRKTLIGNSSEANMKLITGLLAGGCCLAATSVIAEPLRELSDAEMDAVAAGDAMAFADAHGNGNVVITHANTAAHALRDPGRTDRADTGSNVYAAAANASGYSDDTIDTTAVAATSAGGPEAQTTTYAWTVNQLGVEISSGFSHTASPDRGRILGP
jgi:hypothetical protein